MRAPSTGPASPILVRPTWSSINTVAASTAVTVPTTNPTTTTTAAAEAAEADLSTLLARIFTTLPSQLPPRQRSQFHARLQRNSPAPAHSREVARILSGVLTRRVSPSSGRQLLMDFMKRQNGASGTDVWAPVLARAVESIVFDRD